MPLPENHGKHSSRHHVTDHRFALLLEEDFGIETGVILNALIDEPKKAAIAICEWASRTDDPAHALLCWSRKHRSGHHRTDRQDHRQSAARERREDIREQQDGRRRGTAPDRRRDVAGGLDPARIRANLSRMGG